jgi:2-polyprenyl-3-methyl-5-hydroxy-6-metoxy-1,4-benzoquinol methylase
MEYEPLKDKFEKWIKTFPVLRKCFYLLLDLLLLRQRYVKRAIQNYVSIPDVRYYDAGAGFCQYSYHVLKNYPDARVFATDLKGGYLQSFADFVEQDADPAKNHQPDRFSWHTADLQNYVLEDSFNLVTAIDILEHIPDDLAVLRNFHACMDKDAILIISTPSDTDEAAKFTEEHVRPGYNKKELEDKLRSCGFEIVESLYSYGFWGALSWRILLKHPLSLLKKSKATLILLPFYYLVFLPLAQVLMFLDIHKKNTTGTGIIIIASR